MKQIAPSVPLTQPSLVPLSMKQIRNSRTPPSLSPPRPPPLPGCKTGEVFTGARVRLSGRSKQTPNLPPAGPRQFSLRKATI